MEALKNQNEQWRQTSYDLRAGTPFRWVMMHHITTHNKCNVFGVVHVDMYMSIKSHEQGQYKIAIHAFDAIALQYTHTHAVKYTFRWAPSIDSIANLRVDWGCDVGMCRITKKCLMWRGSFPPSFTRAFSLTHSLLLPLHDYSINTPFDC